VLTNAECRASSIRGQKMLAFLVQIDAIKAVTEIRVRINRAFASRGLPMIENTLSGMVLRWLAYAAMVAAATSLGAYMFMRQGWF
jgi:hypothetical protein